MKLIGNYLSPYVRRVGVSLNTMGMPFEFEEVFIFKTPEKVRQYNPLVRIPTLILGNGEVLIESSAILDALDQIAGDERRLVPAFGSERRRVMKEAAIGVGVMEKAQWAFYEGRFRPEEKIQQPWIDHNEKQVLSGLDYLNDAAQKAGEQGWLGDTEKMSQADITAVVAYSFAVTVRPALGIAERVPALAAFADRCEGLEVFKDCPIPNQP
ncbi:MAG: glutathione S-transferase family protein [Arenicellales bacterium]|nr:glutathione S-transferase family protein [Arenicellales bacterium]